MCVCELGVRGEQTPRERGTKMQEVDRDPQGHREKVETQEAPLNVDGGRGRRQKPESDSQREWRQEPEAEGC